MFINEIRIAEKYLKIDRRHLPKVYVSCQHLFISSFFKFDLHLIYKKPNKCHNC